MCLAMVLSACVMGALCPAAHQAPGASSSTQPPAVLTLADTLTRVQERSPLVEGARTRARAAMDARRVVPKVANPFIELRGENYGPASSTLPRDVFATVSQPIELGGERGARVAGADASAAMASARVSDAEWQAIAEAAETYIDAVRAREVMATLVEQRQSVAEIVAILNERLREGVAAEADLRKFDTEHARLASQVTRASIALQSALLRLSALIGEEVAAERLALPELPMMAAPDAGVPQEIVANRADVRAAAAELARAEAALTLERARGVPDVTITAGYKRTSGFDTGVLGVTMAIPLFDRNRVAAATAAGEVGAARLSLQQVRAIAAADIRARQAAADGLAVQAARAEAELIAPAAIVRTAARSAFVEGRGDVLQLVDAERVFGEAAREALELRLDATLAVIHARLAAGEPPLP